MEQGSSQRRHRRGGGGGARAGAYLALGGGDTRDLTLDGGVGAPQVSTQQRLAVHLGLQAGDVAAAEVFAQLVHLLQLQQVDPQHLDGFHHLWASHGGQRLSICRGTINPQEMIHCQMSHSKDLHNNTFMCEELLLLEF